MNFFTKYELSIYLLFNNLQKICLKFKKFFYKNKQLKILFEIYLKQLYKENGYEKIKYYINW